FDHFRRWFNRFKVEDAIGRNEQIELPKEADRIAQTFNDPTLGRIKVDTIASARNHQAQLLLKNLSFSWTQASRAKIFKTQDGKSSARCRLGRLLSRTGVSLSIFALLFEWLPVTMPEIWSRYKG